MTILRRVERCPKHDLPACVEFAHAPELGGGLVPIKSAWCLLCDRQLAVIDPPEVVAA